MDFFSVICLITAFIQGSYGDDAQAPNIVMLMFDDLGWMDLSSNGGQIPTPNMDALITESINLDRHYIHLICSISRSQFLTGRYAMYSGYGKMSPFGIGHIGGIPNGLPTLPQWLKAYNSEYTTYGVGKWHLGYATDSLLPKAKGFDHFFGPYTGAIGYGTGKIVANKCGGCNGDRIDIHDDGNDYDPEYKQITNTMWDYRNKIISYLDEEKEKTSPFYMFLPLQAPHGPLDNIKDYKSQCKRIVKETDSENLSHREKYCEIMMLSDDVVGDIVDKLKETDKWDNTLFIITTDNGGDIENTGCNYPFRGTKGTLFEGNQRVITLIGGGLIPAEQHGTVRTSLFSALDWTPTLLDFAGIYDQIAEEDQTWDGISQYDLVMNGDDYADRQDRDHILFSIGLRNLDSATIVFRYPEDGKYYKYLAQNEMIEKAGYRRTDGWCIPSENGDWTLFENDIEVNPDLDPRTQDVDDKFVFDLTADEGEWHNLLVENVNGEYDVDALVEYAIGLIRPYLDHPLFSQFIGVLWDYQEAEDQEGQTFIHQFMTQDEYTDLLIAGFEDEASKRDNEISDELRALYLETWTPPQNAQNIRQKMSMYARRNENKEEETVSVPTSCQGLDDGKHILKLLEGDEYPLVHAMCSNEYMLIDVKADPEWKKYFTSWSQWHYDVAGPDKNDRVNYNDWFIPAEFSDYIDEYEVIKADKSHRPTKYVISPDCDVCDESADIQQWGEKTSYYMNPAAYGLFFGVRRPACDFDWDSLQCKYCEHSAEGNMVGFDRPYDFSFEDKNVPPMKMIGVCLTETRSAFQRVNQYWEDMVGYGPMNYKPSIGIDGRFCQCAKLNARRPNKQVPPFEVSASVYNDKLIRIAEREASLLSQDLPDQRADDNKVVYLYQKDFEVGTYQITEPGTYVLMEDIEIDFNAPSDWRQLDSVNSPDDNDYWWPPRDMSDKYPGAGYQARDAYMLGYFAGISVETHDVVIDLNQKTIGMSLSYFHQQPFFAIIELMSQPFLPNQGPGFFGADPQFAENVVIKNGNIGRCSHHGIHGTKNKNVRIENVHIHSFMTHGIQMNGYDGLHLENVEVGPTTNEAFLNHNYAHLRILLPYLHKMANYDDKHMEATISFDPELRTDHGREYTMNDLIDIVVPKLDKVFEYVMNEDMDKDELAHLVRTDEDFKLLANADGLPYGAVVYGVYLNYPGSGIFGWDVSDQFSSNLYIKDLEIRDMHHSGKEVLGLSKNQKRFVVNTLLAPLNLEHLFGGHNGPDSRALIKDWIYNSYYPENGEDIRPHYVGNIATDIYFAMYKFGSDHFDEWWLGAPYMGLKDGRIVDWAEGKDLQAMSSKSFGADFWEPICAIDGMVHPGKGLVGLKMTNVNDAVIEGHLNIHDLYSHTGLAEEGVCIARSNEDGGAIAKVVGSQQPPYQAAYSMNQIFAVSAELADIKINRGASISVHNIKSLTGRVLGIAAWFSTKMDFGKKTSVDIHDLYAGINVDKGLFAYEDMPNHASEVCAFAKYDGKKTSVDINWNKQSTEITQQCFDGHIGCFGAVRQTMVSKIDDNADCNFDKTMGLNMQIPEAQFAWNSFLNSTQIFGLLTFGIILVAVVLFKWLSGESSKNEYIALA